MTRSRKALLGVMLVLCTCFAITARPTSNDARGNRSTDVEAKRNDGKDAQIREDLPLEERLRRKGFRYVWVGGTYGEKVRFDNAPGYSGMGWGRRSITLRELCQLIECRPQDFKWPKQWAYTYPHRLITYLSPNPLTTHQRGKYICRIWYINAEFYDDTGVAISVGTDELPANIEDARVQALVNILDASE